MSENNYAAMMIKSAVAVGDDINAILSPGIYIIPPANASSPDATGGVLTVHTGTPIRRTFTSDAVIALTSTRNSNSWTPWKGPLSRTHPFADIKTDGDAAILEALTNLGLDRLRQTPTGTQLFAVNGSTFLFIDPDSWGLFNGTNNVALPVASGGTGALNAEGAIKNFGLDILLAAKAPLVSPALTGIPTAPTAPVGNNSTQLATTEFVKRAISATPPPIGIPFFWPSAAMPNTVMPEWADMVFLKWNGATFSAATYPKLALAIPGLKLTEARGEFVRIWDDGRGVNAGRALLSAESDEFRAHGHDFESWPDSGSPGGTGGAVDARGGDGNSYIRSGLVKGAGGLETRPRNIAFNFLVRAK